MPVSPRKTMCIACRKGRVDKHGEHQVMCAGRGGFVMRHDSIRDLLKQQLEMCAYVVKIEKNAGSPDRSKPGDLKISRWEEGRDLYIDCAIINQKAMEWKRHLVANGVGAAAAAKEKKKIDKYKGKIDEITSEFLPFILETPGGVGRMAIEFMIELEKRRKQRSCELSKTPISISNLDLMTSLSIELQRLNAEMILQRQPRDERLAVRDLTRLESANHSAILEAQMALDGKNSCSLY